MATNAELCNEVRVHLLRLNGELLRPLVGITADDIPKGTQAAVEEYIQYVGVVSFGNRCLISYYRCIGHGLKQLSQPKMDKYGLLRRWIHSKEMEGDIRDVMELIQLNTRSHMVSLPGAGKRIGCLLV